MVRNLPDAHQRKERRPSSKLNWVNGGQCQSACGTAVRTPASKQIASWLLWRRYVSEYDVGGYPMGPVARQLCTFLIQRPP